MLSTTSSLAPVVLAVLLGWTGASKLFGSRAAQQAPKTALARMLSSSERAVQVLRATGLAELVLAAGLLAVPHSPLPGVATALLGAGFAGYLGRARVIAPESSCGCTANDSAPVTWRAFARAGLVLAGGVAAATASAAWWTTVGDRPAASAAVLAAGGAVLTVLSVDLDRWWLLPLRRTRLRIFGHPLAGAAGGKQVPVAATVQLLENSLAWQAASPVVRSGLLDHWEEAGWRFLLYSGVYVEEGGGARPVSVVFALDATASRDTAGAPAARVSVVDADTGEPVGVDLAAVRPRTALPVAG
ncbi:MauE/DoxX family redox-associated membrane protein [Streptomyces ovatisporus]|uniref:MauE/DoxX family redox-associated membrane protein n=1 Tax=Streptomyces ovatisporus TaxID=1128682 RepID=A0ABV9A492_9ACTN